MTEQVITHSAEETIAWGRQIAQTLTAPLLVLLSGELGSGKTTLTKGIVAGLHAAGEDEVTSPTFTLIHEYGSGQRVFHGDLYRVDNFHDFETLGLEDVFAQPAILILEWSEKFPLKAPWPQLRLRLEHLGGDARRITMDPQR
ncbi:MAG TPA: tRNA (adenosine(37)-N6)-threonylcarbamoyltransferase complex ATPase subunit type 1 TsaE [Candidatus Eremiobacteraceae bacterium]|nr:tRNA (adenosine(37)-N6)-threonylcarbamoyltransferase complex ATPase subunit type 1 TsaE [Candidatus Eremiobacteraceae bacterium]